MPTKAKPTQRGRAFTQKPKRPPAAPGGPASRGAAPKATATGGATSGGAAPRAKAKAKPKTRPDQQAPFGKAPWAHPRAYHPGRARAIRIRLSDAEYEAIAAGAESKGLTPTGFAAEAALAAVNGAAVPDHQLIRQAVAALMKGANDVVKVGVNLNQAVAKLNATGQAPRALAHAVTAAEKAVARQDDLAWELAKVVGRS